MVDFNEISVKGLNFGGKKFCWMRSSAKSNGGIYFLADKHFNKVWRELILADPKKKRYFLRKEILANFGGF